MAQPTQVKRDRCVSVNVAMPLSVLESIESVAQARGVSRSEVLRDVAQAYLKNRKAAKP